MIIAVQTQILYNMMVYILYIGHRLLRDESVILKSSSLVKTPKLSKRMPR